MRCGSCSAKLPAFTGRGRAPAYCNRQCQVRAYRARRHHEAAIDLVTMLATCPPSAAVEAVEALGPAAVDRLARQIAEGWSRADSTRGNQSAGAA